MALTQETGMRSSVRSVLLAVAGRVMPGLAVAVAVPGGAATPGELDLRSGGGLFARMWRTSACTDTRSPRCVSLEKNGRGEILLLFTCDSADGSMLALARSRDDGRTWSQPQAVLRGRGAVPRAMGTLTRLTSNRLLAAFDEGPGTLRLLSSVDGGDTWTPSEPVDCGPLLAAVPYGRVVTVDGALLLPVFGTLAGNGTTAAAAGVLRSADGGATWADFTAIACDGTTNFGPTAVHAGTGGALLALVDDRSQYIWRSTSHDDGRTWSAPEPRFAAHHPALAALGDTLFCADYDAHRDGMVRVQASGNLFDSWRCDRTLDANIKGEHFSVLALDTDRVLVAHDRGSFQPAAVIRGTVVTDGLEVVMAQRNPAVPAVSAAIIPAAKRDRWQRLRTLTPPFPPDVGAPVLALTPDGDLLAASRTGLFMSTDHALTYEKLADIPAVVAASTDDRLQLSLVTMLRSGRILLACTDSSDIKDNPDADWRGTYTRVGRQDGYDRWTLSGVRGTFNIHVFFSDDRGRTWRGGAAIDKTPLVWAYANGRFIEEDDGTVVMMAYGCLSAEDTSGRIDCCGVFRSKDGGVTWGDFSRVAYDREFREITYNELDIQPMPDGTWTACIRSEWRTMAPGYPSYGSVAFSADRGRTWSRPELTFPDTGFDLELLPDGGLVYGRAGFRSLVMSYDGGRTWSRQILANTDTYTRLQLLGNGDLLVYGGWGGRRGFVYRRRPLEPDAGKAAASLAFSRVSGPETGGAVLDVGAPGSFDARYAAFPAVHWDGTLYRLWYASWDTIFPGPGGIGLATSSDGRRWTRANAGDPVLRVGPEGAFDARQILGPCVLFHDGLYRMWYGAMDGALHHRRTGIERIGLATSTDGLHWARANAGKPVLDIGPPGAWDDVQVAHPCVIRERDSYRMWYSAYSVKADHTFCVARSADGIHWERENGGKPVVGLNPGRVTGATVRRIGDRYLMLFSGFRERWSIYAAGSDDGIHWRMLGAGNPILPLGAETGFDRRQMSHPCVRLIDDRLRVWYTGEEDAAPAAGARLRIGLAEAAPPDLD